MKKQLIIIGIIVLLILVGLSGCNEQTSIKVENKPPTVSIKADIEQGIAPLNVNFTNLANDSDGIVVHYYWNFDDGSTSNETNPSHIFSQKGKTYNVTLTVTDDKGANTTSFKNIIVLPNQRPTVSASADKHDGVLPLSVSFSGTGTDFDGDIISYQWDFGDGATSDGKYANHTFESFGDYSVKFTVTDNEGATNSYLINIKVKISAVTQDDKGLYDWIKTNIAVLQPTADRISLIFSDLELEYYYMMASYWGGKLFSDAYDAKEKLDEYSYLSSPFESIKNKYAVVLNDYSSIGAVASGITDIYYSDDLVKIYVNGIKNDIDELDNHIYELNEMLNLVVTGTYVPPPNPEVIYTHAYSMYWNIYIFGKIKNIASDNIKDVQIKITFYDASDNIIEMSAVTPTTFTPHLSIIRPQETSVFNAKVFGTYYDHYEVEVTSFKTTNEKPYTDVSITEHYREDFLTCPRVKGIVENVGSKVATGYIYANFYDSSGDLIAVEYTSLYNLYSGQSQSFEITYFDDEYLPSSVTDYDLELTAGVK